jgi:hypothetical protein
MKRVTLPGIVLFAVAVAVSAAETPRTLQPVDEGAMNPDFLAFRTRLQATVAKHDTKALLDILDPEIRASFGSDHGIEAFKALWNLDDPASELWKELGAVLAMGGTFSIPTEFTAPYTFSKWPGDVDSFEFVAMTGSNVRIRSAPRSDAPVLATVSYAILQVDDEAGFDAKQHEWTGVKFEGKKAYVSTQFVRSPIDYRARFSYSGGRWRMIFFLAGD